MNRRIHMAFHLDIPKKEEIQKIVEEETSLDQETQLVISDVSICY